MSIKMYGLLLGLVLILGCAEARSESPVDRSDPVTVLRAYIDAIAKDDVSAATALWDAVYLAEAGRLPIRYQQVLYPYDLASPVILEQAALRNGSAKLTMDPAMIAGQQATLKVSISGGGESRSFTYGAVKNNNTWALVDALWLQGGHWPVHETRYVRLHVQHDQLYCQDAGRQLDDFIQQTGTLLGLTDAQFRSLSENRITYYLCDDATVAQLTGYPTKGMAHLATSSVISCHFPHFHELAHVLVNLALGDVPLYTLPLLQEGLACRLGGRWGRSPAVLLYTGWVNQTFQMVDLLDILTWDGFFTHPGGADVTYPAAALFCDLIAERSGWPRLLNLYRDLSGDWATVSTMSKPQVQAVVKTACGWPRNSSAKTLANAFHRWWPRYKRCGIDPDVGAMPIRAADMSESGFQLWKQDDQWIVNYTPDQAVSYVTFYVPGHEAPLGRCSSSLFSDHFPDAPYDGARFGLRCSVDNISLYDYVDNILLATWVAGFSDEAGACGQWPGPLRFRLQIPPNAALSYDLRLR